MRVETCSECVELWTFQGQNLNVLAYVALICEQSLNQGLFLAFISLTAKEKTPSVR